MTTLYKKYLFLLLAICILPCCSTDDECREESLIQLRASFYTQKLDTATNTYSAITHTPDSITVYGVGNDSLLYNAARSRSYIYLPLNKNAETSSFVLHYSYSPDTLTTINAIDTLCITYTNDNRFISLECGCFVYQTINDLQITHNALDSVEIINQQVTTTTDEEHLRLYF